MMPCRTLRHQHFFALHVVIAAIALAGCGSPAPAHHPECAVAGACPSSSRGVAPSGFTNNTGWSPGGTGCCDICSAAGTRKVNCFDAATCGHKTGDDDWDFLVLDQIWLPQLCRALAHGHDPTLTHLPGAVCRADATRRSSLSIHGLWPNYVGGYPQCCRHISLPQKLPLEVLTKAREEWVDPTHAAATPGKDDECAFCSMWAHETMKHGTCFAMDMIGYFKAALGLLERLQEYTRAANELLANASQVAVKTNDLIHIFAPRRVQILCDDQDANNSKSAGVFLELRTCWNRTANQQGDSDLVWIDCPGKPVGTPCPELLIAVSDVTTAQDVYVI
eukprot:TRINITY_DN63248_c0_g1_i1.p1 TRINITY_DN63248_c0_g1~~TRINITY_DN63248_c0_g1_i1.p1  ORF type:complete len:334 (-),score=39.23 TRINITY_DN63248_c0_g1_i1:283-1284(-)